MYKKIEHYRRTHEARSDGRGAVDLPSAQGSVAEGAGPSGSRSVHHDQASCESRLARFFTWPKYFQKNAQTLDDVVKCFTPSGQMQVSDVERGKIDEGLAVWFSKLKDRQKKSSKKRQRTFFNGPEETHVLFYSAGGVQEGYTFNLESDAGKCSGMRVLDFWGNRIFQTAHPLDLGVRVYAQSMRNNYAPSIYSSWDTPLMKSQVVCRELHRVVTPFFSKLPSSWVTSRDTLHPVRSLIAAPLLFDLPAEQGSSGYDKDTLDLVMRACLHYIWSALTGGYMYRGVFGYHKDMNFLHIPEQWCGWQWLLSEDLFAACATYRSPNIWIIFELLALLKFVDPVAYESVVKGLQTKDVRWLMSKTLDLSDEKDVLYRVCIGIQRILEPSLGVFRNDTGAIVEQEKANLALDRMLTMRTRFQQWQEHCPVPPSVPLSFLYTHVPMSKNRHPLVSGWVERMRCAEGACDATKAKLNRWLELLEKDEGLLRRCAEKLKSFGAQLDDAMVVVFEDNGHLPSGVQYNLSNNHLTLVGGLEGDLQDFLNLDKWYCETPSVAPSPGS